MKRSLALILLPVALLALAPGIAAADPLRPRALTAEAVAQTGCSFRQTDADTYCFTETSEAVGYGNRGGEFVLELAPDAPVLQRIREILAQPEGESPVDFVIRGTLTPPEEINPRLVSLTMRIAVDGSTGGENFGVVDVKHSGLYRTGVPFALEEAYGRLRLRVRPCGGRRTVRQVQLRLAMRVDGNARPETLTLRHPRIEELGPAPAGTSRRVVLCPLGFPPEPMLRVWSSMGLGTRAADCPAEGETVAGVFIDELRVRPETAERIARYVREQKAFLCVGVGAAELTGVPSALASVLPVNTWTMAPTLRRAGSLLEPFGPNAMIADMRIPSVSFRFDLHVPGAPVESPLIAYEPEKLLRDPAEWAFIETLSVSQPSSIPILVHGNLEGASVLVFGATFDDVAFTAPGYAMDAALRAPVTEPREPGHEPVRPRPRWADAVPPREPRDAATAVIRTPEGVPAPIRPYEIALEESEADGIEDLEKRSPGPREGIDGITSYRYVYRPGVSPRVRIRLRNHLTNLAPFATAADCLWPENPSASGLNDRAQTDAHLRNTLPIHAVWTGRQGTDRQRVSLTWAEPVRPVSFRLTGNGPYRFRNRANPRDFSFEADGTPLRAFENARYTEPPSAPMRAFFEGTLSEAPPPAVRELAMNITGLDPAANLEPRRDWLSNVSLCELEVFGWPAAGVATAEPVSAGHLQIVRKTLLTEAAETVAMLPVPAVAPCSETVLEAALPPLDAFGPAVYELRWLDGDGTVRASARFDVLFIPEGHDAIVRKIGENILEQGLLCTPGWRNADSFGLGMNNWSRGWGGPHDQTWALEADVYESGVRNRDAPGRMLTTAQRVSHYTNPWGRFPNGEPAFSWTMERLLDRFREGGDLHGRGWRGVHVVGSDRWNGVNVATCYNWNVFIDFDRWLRANGQPGLSGRTRPELVQEITARHGDAWQRFNLERYARQLQAVRKRFEAEGLSFSWETHGSFPLCGGDLGKALADTHIGVGTDLFWELRKQDLWASLGSRIAIVAVNPDLRSGAYDEWGWVNSDANRWWYANNGTRDVAMRQWLATYFLGRIRTDGVFRPYHEMGFGAQGNHGPRYTIEDHRLRCRVHNLVTHLRPEAPEGFGLVVSWRAQERRMSPQLGRAGFGLYPGDGAPSIEAQCEQVFTPFVKAGFPISYVASTESLRALAEQPAETVRNLRLFLVDAFAWDAEEVAAAEKLRAAGALLIPVGPAAPEAPARRQWSEPRGPSADGPGGVLPVCKSLERLDERDAILVHAQLRAWGCEGVSVSDGMTAVAFRTHGLLAVAVCNQADTVLTGFVSVPDAWLLRCADLFAGTVSRTGRSGTFPVTLPPSGATLLLFAPIP